MFQRRFQQTGFHLVDTVDRKNDLPYRSLFEQGKKWEVPAGKLGEKFCYHYVSANFGFGSTVVEEWATVWDDFRISGGIPGIVFPLSEYALDFARWGKVTASKNEAILVNPRQEFRRDPLTRLRTYGDFLWYSDEILLDLFREIDPSVEDHIEEPFNRLNVPVDSGTFYMRHFLSSYLRGREQVDHLLVEEIAIQVLRRIVLAANRINNRDCSSRRKATDEAHKRAVHEAKRYIAGHFRDPLKLAEISAAAGVSKTHFCSIFSRLTGSTIHGYVMDLRLREAFLHLPECRGNQTDLALELGFSDGNHLSTAFRNRFGSSPSHLQKRFALHPSKALRNLLLDS